jgi:hypothetical protein
LPKSVSFTSHMQICCTRHCNHYLHSGCLILYLFELFWQLTNTLVVGGNSEYTSSRGLKYFLFGNTFK